MPQMSRNYCVKTSSKKMGFSQRSSCKAQGFLKRSSKKKGKYIISPKYKKDIIKRVIKKLINHYILMVKIIQK